MVLRNVIELRKMTSEIFVQFFDDPEEQIILKYFQKIRDFVSHDTQSIHEFQLILNSLSLSCLAIEIFFDRIQ
jgi:hypothetical protein